MQIEYPINAEMVMKSMSDCTDVLTQEFCDNANYSIIDAWLFRKHASTGGATASYFSDSNQDRTTWYDGISAVDPRLVFMAFSDLVGHAVRSEAINFETFNKNCLQNYNCIEEIERVHTSMKNCFEEFLTELLFPWLVDKQTKGKPFLKKIIKLMFDTQIPDIDFFDYKNFIVLVESISRAKRIFCKYYMGAYPFLDGFNGLYTPHERISKIQKGHNNARCLDEDIEGMFCRVFGENGDREKLSHLYLNADIQALLAYSKVPFSDELQDCTQNITDIFENIDGIYNRYIQIRGTAQGEMMRSALCMLALEWNNQGGKILE